MTQVRLIIVPITFRTACDFILEHHRHHVPTMGQKFALGVEDPDGVLRGVAVIGRPVARHLDRFTAEVNRTCTDGTANANSALYGAAWRAARAMGYTRLVTYTQEGESGASLRGAGWKCTGPTGEKRGWGRPKRDRDDTHEVGITRYRWEKSVGPSEA